MTTEPKRNESSFEAILGPDDIILVKARGDVTRENLPKLDVWAKQMDSLMAALYAKDPEHVMTLADVTEVVRYDLAMTKWLKEFFERNRKYNPKTAIFGADFLVSTTLRSLATISGRSETLKVFSNFDEAAAWLLGSKEKKGSSASTLADKKT